MEDDGSSNDWKSLLGISAFLIFLLWDLIRSIAKCNTGGICRVPGKALVLSGLTLQLWGYLDIKNVDVFGKGKGEFKKMFRKQLLTDVSRLTLCVFLAYAVPSMPMENSGQRWANIAALVISLSFHIATEVYASSSYVNVAKVSRGWFVSSNVVLSVAATCLVVYLGISVLLIKNIKRAFTYGIPCVLSKINLGDEGDNLKWQKFPDEVIKFWVVARTRERHSKLSSFELSPGAAGILIICVAVMVAKMASNTSLVYDVVTLPFCLQCVFIVIGFIIILWRFLISARNQLESYEYIETRRAILLTWISIKHSLSPRVLLKEFIPESVQIMRKPLEILYWIVYATIMLPLLILLLVTILLLLLFNYFCLVLIHLVIRSIILCFKFAHLPRGANSPGRMPQDDKSFSDYKPLLKHIMTFGDTPEEEHQQRLQWRHTQKLLGGVKDNMNKAHKNGQSCSELFCLIEGSVAASRSRLQDEPYQIKWWKGNAVMTIKTIVKLRNKYGWNLDGICDINILIKAYKQVKDLLEFVDCPDNTDIGLSSLLGGGNMLHFVLSAEADKWLSKTERSVNTQKQQFPEAATLEFVRSQFSNISESGKRSHKDVLNDFRKVTYMNISVYKIISEESKSYTQERELVNSLITLLADIIACCVLKLPELILDRCKRWTEEFQTEKIEKACEIAAKVSAIMDKWKGDKVQANTNTDIGGTERHDKRADGHSCSPERRECGAEIEQTRVHIE